MKLAPYGCTLKAPILSKQMLQDCTHRCCKTKGFTDVPRFLPIHLSTMQHIHRECVASQKLNSLNTHCAVSFLLCLMAKNTRSRKSTGVQSPHIHLSRTLDPTNFLQSLTDEKVLDENIRPFSAYYTDIPPLDPKYYWKKKRQSKAALKIK